MTHVFVWTLESIIGVILFAFFALLALLVWIESLCNSWKRGKQKGKK